jgi:hypothetical protein
MQHRSASSALSSRKRLYDYRSRPALQKRSFYPRGVLLTYAQCTAGGLFSAGQIQSSSDALRLERVPYIVCLEDLIPQKELQLDELIPSSCSLQEPQVHGLCLSAPPGLPCLAEYDDEFDVDETVVPSLCGIDLPAPSTSSEESDSQTGEPCSERDNTIELLSRAESLGKCS